MVQLWQVWSRKMLGHICTSEICPQFLDQQNWRFPNGVRSRTDRLWFHIVTCPTGQPANPSLWSRQPAEKKTQLFTQKFVVEVTRDLEKSHKRSNLWETKAPLFYCNTFEKNFEMYPWNSKFFPIAFLPSKDLALVSSTAKVRIAACMRSKDVDFHTSSISAFKWHLNVFFFAKPFFSLSQWQTPLGSRGWYPMGQPTGWACWVGRVGITGWMKRTCWGPRSSKATSSLAVILDTCPTAFHPVSLAFFDWTNYLR